MGRFLDKFRTASPPWQLRFSFIGGVLVVASWHANSASPPRPCKKERLNPFIAACLEGVALKMHAEAPSILQLETLRRLKLQKSFLHLTLSTIAKLLHRRERWRIDFRSRLDTTPARQGRTMEGQSIKQMAKQCRQKCDPCTGSGRRRRYGYFSFDVMR